MEIIDLDKLDPKKNSSFGGKAEGLARLIKAGDHSSENKQFASGGKGGVFEKLPPLTPQKTFVNLKSKALVPRGFAVSAGTLPVDRWPVETRNIFKEKVRALLAQGLIAIRSSALGEDSAEKSFAGMFETVLHIGSEKEALAAADLCIASGSSERVEKYAGSESAIPVGLVVQQQVEAKAAGVCFTIDPTGRDRAVVIEAVPGLGDKLVSGQVEPRRFRVYRSGTGAWEIPEPGGQVLHVNISPNGAKRVGAPHPRRQEKNNLNFISLETIEAIAAGAKELEEKFGFPLDIEWAMDHDDRVWWLQARPVTAAAEPPDYIIQRSNDAVDDGPITVWSNWNVRETMPQPLFPFTWSFWRDKLQPVVVGHLAGVSQKSRLLPFLYPLDVVHGRIYFNLNGMLSAPVIGALSQQLISTVDSRAGDTLKYLKKIGVLRGRKLPGSSFFIFFSILKAGIISFFKMLRHLDPEKSMKILADDCWAIARRTPLHLLSDAELREEFDLWASPECKRILYGLQMELVAMVIYEMAKKAFKKHPQALDLLCTGIPANPTTKISLTIDALTEAAEPFKDLFLEPLPTGELLQRLQKEQHGPGWLDDFNTFLEENGHRGPMEFDLGSTRWSDDPTMIIEIIRSGLKLPQREKLSERMARLSARREQALQEAIAASPRWKRPIMRRLARAAARFMPLREAPKHYAVIVFQRIRHAALELGVRLAKKGLLPEAGDVFFLEIAELNELIEGKDAAHIPDKLRERKQMFSRYKKETPPGFFRSDGVPVIEALDFSTPLEEGLLRGSAISGGTAEGPICVLTEPDPKLVQQGDVLVMEYADPGWTPLFPRAAGIVMEVGGLMCHAAVVARELGIPAVFGVSDATAILQKGQRVEVNGTKGIVRITQEAG